MPFGLSSRGKPGVFHLVPGEKLNALERIVLLAIIAGLVVFDVFALVVTPGVDPVASLLSIATSAIFTLYLWSPLVATALLGGVFVLSFVAVTVTDTTVLIAAAVAAGLVMRLGSTALILSYTAGFLVAGGIVAYADPDAPVNVGIYLIIATVSGAVGYALRIASARGSRLERELAAQEEQERQAVLAERRWIAGELHDSIAHHLTVVALHVQMLDDADASPGSQEAIRIAARKAMTDLRFVIELADDGPRSAGMSTGDLTAAIDEAAGEFESAGHAVLRSGDASDERIPRAAEIILARIMRESATNILKYAGAGEVSIALDVDDEAVALAVSSPVSATPRRELSSSRTGIGRMAERVLGASGEFSAGDIDGRWVVSARLPLV